MAIKYATNIEAGGQFPLIDSEQIKGGLRYAETFTELEEVSSDFLKPGTFGFVNDESKLYMYNGSEWILYRISGSTPDIPTDPDNPNTPSDNPTNPPSEDSSYDHSQFVKINDPVTKLSEYVADRGEIPIEQFLANHYVQICMGGQTYIIPGMILEGVNPPTIKDLQTNKSNKGKIQIICNKPSATTYYKINDGEFNSFTESSKMITLQTIDNTAQQYTITSYSALNGQNSSETVETITVKDECKTPIINATHSNGQSQRYIEATCSTPNATIYYKFNTGAYTEYTNKIEVNSNGTYYFYAKRDDLWDSNVQYELFNDQLAKPSLSYDIQNAWLVSDENRVITITSNVKNFTYKINSESIVHKDTETTFKVQNGKYKITISKDGYRSITSNTITINDTIPIPTYSCPGTENDEHRTLTATFTDSNYTIKTINNESKSSIDFIQDTAFIITESRAGFNSGSITTDQYRVRHLLPPKFVLDGTEHDPSRDITITKMSSVGTVHYKTLQGTTTQYTNGTGEFTGNSIEITIGSTSIPRKTYKTFAWTAHEGWYQSPTVYVKDTASADNDTSTSETTYIVNKPYFYYGYTDDNSKSIDLTLLKPCPYMPDKLPVEMNGNFLILVSPTKIIKITDTKNNSDYQTEDSTICSTLTHNANTLYTYVWKNQVYDFSGIYTFN